MRLRPLAAALAGLLVATLVTAGPAAAGSLLDRANRALQQAGDKIEKAAEETGREVQDFLVDNPALNRDLVDLGKRLGLPGFDKTRPESGAGLIAAPSPTAPGGTVELAAVGLPGNTKVTVAAGPSVDKAKQIAKGTTSDRGGLQITVKAPEDTAPGSTLSSSSRPPTPASASSPSRSPSSPPTISSP